MKKSANLRILVSFCVGLIFSLGLGISGMTQPQKIIGFLNPFDWDPSLIFVMIGAVGTHMALYPAVRKRRTPLIETQWHIPSRKDISLRLLLGSAIFGAGWGLAGYCPGPAVTSLASGQISPSIFVAAMLAGMIFFKVTEPYLKLRE